MKLYSDLQKDVVKRIIDMLTIKDGYDKTIEGISDDFNNNDFVIYNVDCYDYLLKDSNGVDIFDMYNDIKTYDLNVFGEITFNEFDSPFKVCNYLSMIYFDNFTNDIINLLSIDKDTVLSEDNINKAVDYLQNITE